METPLITFRCPPGLLVEVEVKAKELGLSRSDVLRLALVAFCSNRKGE